MPDATLTIRADMVIDVITATGVGKSTEDRIRVFRLVVADRTAVVSI
jgi:hypothetical protein